ncbi:MAG TPA: VOC family protein [Steroidobacteraceae bacterium]|nr:VOC family protein [Steroidobacteraceae bacterium]
MAAHAPDFKVTGIDHIVLRVRDLPRALAFYRDVLGCTLEREQRELGLTQLRAGRSLIDLVTADGPLGARAAPAGGSGPNLEHFCLSLAPFDERSLTAHLASHGVAAGEAAARYGAEGEGRSLYIEDPEGNRVELKGGRSGG